MKKIFLLLTTISILLTSFSSAWAVPEINLYFPPIWKEKPKAANKIAHELSLGIGIKIIPQIADCYPEILTALSQKKPVLAYVGSMVQTIVWLRKLGTPLVQAHNSKENYGGLMIVPKGVSATGILQDYPAEIAYTVGATSGEVCAKAATNGKASIAVTDHAAALDAIRNGKAKAAFVKNTWWNENINNYSEFEAYTIPGISEYKNADNVLFVSNFVTPEIKSLILRKAIKNPQIFNADNVTTFVSSEISYTLKLMKKAGIDPLTYSWQPVHSGPCTGESTATPLIPPESKSQPQLPSGSGSQKEQSLSAGKMLLENTCGDCHLVLKLKQYRRKSRKQWEKTIGNMPVKLTEQEHEDLIIYLLSLKKK